VEYLIKQGNLSAEYYKFTNDSFDKTIYKSLSNQN